jgi:alpha-galactosidase
MAECCRVPYEEMVWECAGLNHNAWFTRLEHKGADLYPALKRRVARDKKFRERDPVRFDFMLHMGYYVTESSGHFSEYVPYYRKRKDLRKKYCREGFNGGDSFYADNWPAWRKKADKYRQRIMDGKEPLKPQRSLEFGSGIIHAILTDKPYIFHGSTWNTALIDNLPYDGVVEVPVLVDKQGFHPTHFGPLPDQCAAMNRAHMAVNKLVAEACVEGNREKAVWGLMLDPLTAAVCSPAEIKEMFDRMFKAERRFLKGF